MISFLGGSNENFAIAMTARIAAIEEPIRKYGFRGVNRENVEVVVFMMH